MEATDVNSRSGSLRADDQFFASLLGGNAGDLSNLLTDDFILIDVMSGSEIDKESLLEVIRSGRLRFKSIAPADRRVRTYGDVSLVTGRTRMEMGLGGRIESANSRYTHVFVKTGGLWRLASAQGTQITPAPAT